MTELPELDCADFTTATGCRLRIRVVRPGDRYGHELCVVMDDGLEPVLEFFDAAQAHDYYHHGPTRDAKAVHAFCLGQFLARYRLSTILGNIGMGMGVVLSLHAPRFNVDWKSLVAALVDLELYRPPTTKESLLSIIRSIAEEGCEDGILVRPGMLNELFEAAGVDCRLEGLE